VLKFKNSFGRLRFKGAEYLIVFQDVC
jgi:hypothetical protein